MSIVMRFSRICSSKLFYYASPTPKRQRHGW